MLKARDAERLIVVYHDDHVSHGESTYESTMRKAGRHFVRSE